MEKSLSEQLADNLAYYVNDPSKRCKNEYDVCSYSGETISKDTDGCFVGRLMEPIDRLKADKNSISCVENLVDCAKECGIELPPIIKDNEDIMIRFQVLHDSDSYWDEKGLSDLGKDALKKIIINQELGEKFFEKFLAD